jgi:tRNA pseudouridine55 synthase
MEHGKKNLVSLCFTLRAPCFLIRAPTPGHRPLACHNQLVMTHFGILNINKPPQRSSRDVVDVVQRLVRPAKAGHAGTLDPLATGVLVICVGQATRLIQCVQRQPKRYRATFILGVRSETDDVEGSLTPLEGAPRPTRAAIEAILPRFVGNIQQRPPAHSAVKIAGRRAYELARAGKPVEPALRTVTIHRLEVRRLDYPELELDIECGSGTYVRSLGRDLAVALRTVAVLSALQRLAIGSFRLEDALAADEIDSESLREHLLHPLTAVAELPRVELAANQLKEIQHGRPIELSTESGAEAADAEWAGIDATGQLKAILRMKKPGELWPICNFS